MKVLFVASNPTGSLNLNLEGEINALQRKFFEAAGEPVSFIPQPRLPFDDLPGALSSYRPDVLHISAHGATEQLSLMKNDGTRTYLTAEALDTFMRSAPPRLVYLNACNSRSIAEKLANSVELAIGSTAAISNMVARTSAVSFYEQILAGMPLGIAFDVAHHMAQSLGDQTVDLEAHARPGSSWRESVLHQVPRLLARFGSEERFSAEGGFDICFGLSGAPAALTQMIFFTDNRAYATGRTSYLSALCALTHNAPVGGVVWSDEIWLVEADMRMFAVGTTADGRTFSVASSVVKALQAGYRDRADRTVSRGIARAIERLGRAGGAAIDRHRL